ncbi:MAG: pyridoxal-phosphate dependent enzyme [Pseudomonadota bacterium]
MKVYDNPNRAAGLHAAVLDDVPFPSVALDAAAGLLRRCPLAARTRLRSATALARGLGVGALHIKDERDRMGLGSFKALGAAYVIARDAQDGSAALNTYVTASAGNHGLSVAAGAQAFGAKAVIFLSRQVPEAFATRLSAYGADVVRAGETYEESMAAAAASAERTGAVLLSDSSWPGYTERPYILMEGYLALMQEVFEQMASPPSHIFLQAGVGGLAGAAAAAARAHWGDGPCIVVVEPDAAPALAASIAAGEPVTTSGPHSNMGRLDCKEPSLIALKGLSRDADFCVTISDEEADAGADLCAGHDLHTTPSGAAGVAAAFALDPDQRLRLALDAQARILAIVSEGPERP